MGDLNPWVHCVGCGAYLAGSYTLHRPGCFVLAMIERAGAPRVTVPELIRRRLESLARPDHRTRNLLEKAIALAVDSHEGQTDKQGRPYILHVLRVMHSFTGQEEDDESRIVAVLHDIVEDCDTSLAELLGVGFPPSVLEAIDALSRRKDETYDKYLIRVLANPLAVRVKVADLVDNLDPNRPSTALIGSHQRDKYLAAWKMLRLHQKKAEGIPCGDH